MIASDAREAGKATGRTVAVAPSASELRRLAIDRGVDPRVLEHALDPRERVRSQRVGSGTLVVLRVPCVARASGDPPFVTETLGLLESAEDVLVLTTDENDVVRALRDGALDRAAAPQIVVAALRATAESYASYLETIELAIDRIELRLARSRGNREVLELLLYQKTLVHYTAALRSTCGLVERIRSNGHLPSELHDEIDDVAVELRQALETADLERETLGATMDAFASIISNNLNDVMRVLTGATVVLTPPIAVASFWGMNVALPLQQAPWSFVALLILSAASSAGVAVWLRLRGWL
jgi:magnesium transporter